MTINTLHTLGATEVCYGYVKNTGSAVLTAVAMKSSIIWDVLNCNLIKVNRHFGSPAFIFRVDKQAT
jgi:hypothetical protein